MNPQDRTAVRTASDIERKYNLKGMTKQVEMQKDNLYKLEYNLTNFANSVTKDLVNLQDQVDGNITTWFSNGEPSLESYPASEWLEEQKNTHLGDLYYDSNTGYSYRFAFENEQYHWIKLTDSDVTKALAMANSAQDTADSKRRIFLETPSVPYDNGDMWIKDQEIYICQISKDENQTFDENDFIVATKYTDNTLANQVNDRITVVAGQVTTIEQNVSKISAEMQDAKYYVDEEGNKILITNQINKLSATAYGLNQITESAGGNNIFRNTGLWFENTGTNQETEIQQTKNVYKNDEFITFYDFCQENSLENYEMYKYITVPKNLIKINNNAIYKISFPNLNLSSLSDDTNLKELNISLYCYDESLQNMKFISLDKNQENIIKIEEPYNYIIFLVTVLRTPDINNTNEVALLKLENVKNAFNEFKIYENTTKKIWTSEYEYWDGVVSKSGNENAVNYNSMLLQNGSLSQEQEVPNGNYSISFYYQKLIELANASVVINDIEYPLDSLEVKQFYTGEQDSETGEYITHPIQVTNNHIKIEFKCDTNGGVEVYDLMCNKGTVKLAYSQNQNETTTDTVNISKGITITSTNIDAVFKANANGIKILTLQGATVAYFTDKGMSTKEIVVENKGQVCGTLIQEVDGQTWFTRM